MACYLLVTQFTVVLSLSLSLRLQAMAGLVQDLLAMWD